MSETSPLTEASSSSLDELFARKPPFSSEELARLKAEFRRLRDVWAKSESGEGPRPKAKRAPKSAPRTTIVADDIFAEDPSSEPSSV